MRVGLVGPWVALCSVFEKAASTLLHFSSQALLKKQGRKSRQQHFSRTERSEGFVFKDLQWKLKLLD